MSKYVAFFLGVIVLAVAFVFTSGNIISWDAFGYYLYLPLVFIYRDLGIQDFSVIEHIINTYQNVYPPSNFYVAYRVESGAWVIRYTSGMAVVYAPFFFIGHIAAKLLGYPADGFSKPYQYAIFYGGLLWTFLGIFFCRKVLRHFFSEVVTSLILILIVLGTNYLYHVSVRGSGAYTHNYLFTLYAMAVYYTLRWHQMPKVKYVVMLGLACGVAVLIRPTEAVIFLIPLLWGVYNQQTLREKIYLLREKKNQVFLFGLIVGALISI